MHWNIRFDADRNYTHAYQSGKFSLKDHTSFLNAILESPFWRPGNPLVIDYCSLEMEELDYDRLEATCQIMTLLNEKLGNGRLALLCDDDERFGVGRQIQSSIAAHVEKEISVFRDEDAAIDWVTCGSRAKASDLYST